MNTPSEDVLRQMPYSELRKYARKSGIKGNRKAENLIASILEKNSREDSFVTMERKVINSCSKLKEEKFNKDKLVASATPRRETYTVDCPLDDLVVRSDMVVSSASPVLRKSPQMNDSLNVTLTRGSQKKSKKRKVSFITPVRKSMRLSALTPQFASVKDRPKTPIPHRSSSSKKMTPYSHKKISLKLALTPNEMDGEGRSSTSGGGKERRPSTPMPQSKQKRMKKNSIEKSAATDLSTPTIKHLGLLKEVESEKCTPRSGVKRTATASLSSITKRNITTPSSDTKKTTTRALASASKSKRTTPLSDMKKNASPQVAVTNRKGTTTPNFNKLHQKVFDKMESIDEYQKRKVANSAKKLDEQKRFQDRIKSKKTANVNSKIPKKFGGIPFIPSVTSVKDIKTNFSLFGQETNSLPDKKTVTTVSLNTSSVFKRTPVARAKTLKSISCENTPLKKNKFDLQASLSKKLRYKPHTGPLKPLGVKSLNTTLPILPNEVQKKETVNQTVKSKRIQSRTVLKGVRTNRRFELQMKNRKPISS